MPAPAMASLTSSSTRDFGLCRFCVLSISTLLCLTRTVGAAIDHKSQSRALTGLSELKNTIPEAGNLGLLSTELWKPVSLGAGVSDGMATVGRVFKLTVPQDAFWGDHLQYQITEAGRESLPSWLFYNNETNTLWGIPSEADLDQYYMQIMATGRSFNSSTAVSVTDVFSISVLPERRVFSTAAIRLKDATTSTNKVSCSEDEAVIEATVLLDANWDKLSAEERLEVISKMSKHSRLGMDVFRLLPAGSKSLLEGSLMVAGPGNIKREKHPGVALSWRIGCSTTNNVDKFPVVTVLESASQDGTMASELKHDIIGWRVTNDKPDRLKRARRQAVLMGTPMPTPVPTATTPKPSTLKDTTVVLPSATVTISRMFTIVEPTPTSVPTMSRPTSSIRPTPTASPSKTQSLMPTPSSSLHKPTVSSVIKIHTSIPELTPTPVSTSTTLTPTPSLTSQPSPATTPTPTPSVSKPPIPEPTKASTVPPTPTKPRPTTPSPQITTSTTASEVTTPPSINTPPEIRRRLKRVDAVEGKLLHFTIPRHTFRDAEDGDTRNLDLVVLTYELTELDPRFWLKFDKKSQTLTGLPLKEQAKKERYQLILVAQDSEGLEIQNAFEVVVASSSSEEGNLPPVKMGMTLDIDYDVFINDPEMQSFVLNKIAKAFGDRNADAITITDIRRGSVIISWVNNTLPKDTCNRELILDLQSKIMTPDGKPTQALIDALQPEFHITEVEALPLGACATTTPSPEPTPTEEAEEPEPQEMWISIVLPAVIIAVLLLLAGIIIFILYRKSRKGKLSDEDQNTFINKGIPIIFADEIEDGEKPPSSSSPLIMKTEKPPLSPPEYTETQQPLMSNNSQPGEDEDDKHSLPMVDMSGTPSYQPPPPLSPSPPENRNNPPARDISSYRKPPAYVHIQP